MQKDGSHFILRESRASKFSLELLMLKIFAVCHSHRFWTTFRVPTPLFILADHLVSVHPLLTSFFCCVLTQYPGPFLRFICTLYA
jgi:hypothetical protein